MKKLLLLLVLISTVSFADFGVARVWHLTYENATKKCAIDVVLLTSGKVKSTSVCFNK